MLVNNFSPKLGLLCYRGFCSATWRYVLCTRRHIFVTFRVVICVVCWCHLFAVTHTGHPQQCASVSATWITVPGLQCWEYCAVGY